MHYQKVYSEAKTRYYTLYEKYFSTSSALFIYLMESLRETLNPGESRILVLFIQ